MVLIERLLALLESGVDVQRDKLAEEVEAILESCPLIPLKESTLIMER